MMSSPIRQGGMTTLAITSLLLAVLMVSAVFAHRGLLLEQRSSGNRYKAAQAFEAAEAGLEWTIAQLNDTTPIGEDCLPADDSAARPFRERYLEPGAHGEWVPRADTGSIGCATSAAGTWACNCPAPPGNPEPAGSDTGTRFAVRLLATEWPGQLRLIATGCRHGPCQPGTPATADATAQVQVLLARLPGLGTEPAAALTVRSAMTLADGPFHLHHTDPSSGGMTLHTGGSVDAPGLQLSSVPGAPAAASALMQDAMLAELDTSGFFASIFRMDRSTWKQQPMVQSIDCSTACDTPLGRVAGAAAPPQLIWLSGGLNLSTPLTLGSAERPVLLVVDGPTTLHATLALHGLVYTTDARWNDEAGASIQGALVFESALNGSGGTRIHHDSATLQALQRRTGTFARVPGSWRDF